MLRYEVRLGRENFKQQELEWREKYVSPDLSYMTGVTSPSYHLEKYDKLATKSSIVNSNSILSLEAYNVTRQGFVVAVKKKYEVKSGITYDYSLDRSGDTINYYYLEINGKYFYFHEIREGVSGFTIDNLLNYNEDVTPNVSENIEVSSSTIPPNIEIDTVYWIEDGKVVIDGNEYIYDKNEGFDANPSQTESDGILKYGEDGDALAASSITDCDRFEFHPYHSSDDYETVTKFTLGKQEEISEPFSMISFCKYYYFIKYKNHYCQLKKVIDGDTYKFVCQIPSYVVKGDDSLEPLEYDVYYTLELGNESAQDLYIDAVNNGKKLDSEHYEEHRVKLLDEVKNIIAFVYIADDEVYLSVEHDVVNANSGNEIILHLDNVYSPLKVGNNIEFVNRGKDEVYRTLVYNSEDYNGKNEDFIVFNGRKYIVQKNICDKAVINGEEYDISYINGKVDGVDCLVLINGEEVPMKLISEGDEWKVQRYGKIVLYTNSSAMTATYDINSYDGVIINNRIYEVLESEPDGVEMRYASIYLNNVYTFEIIEIMGNSTYICKPFINTTDFTEEFNRYISEQICRDLVNNQSIFEARIKNKVFGESEITSDLAFRVTNTPISSSDFYDVFKDLTIFIDSGYIHIPIQFTMDVGGNVIQDDIVEHDFFEKEKKKAINPIVDMEKDVYVPKYIYGHYDGSGHIVTGGSYSGATTIFKPIYDINLNFHFRTRDLSSWKVNDGYNQVVYSADSANQSSDNWFITDFYPYREILDSSGDTLQKTSDLMGFLYFTNDDIFYQRSKVAKSFVRLSFYDSTDPQTQSLLATSCVFVDEHALFKKFIDNSRKNLYEYGRCVEPTYETDKTTGYIRLYGTGNNKHKKDITQLSKVNKISVTTEFLGAKKDHISYSSVTNDCKNIKIDESRRISSRLTISNKYVTDTSSEGYYLYIFREYAEKLHPKPIYMKVEFNHAGIGKTIPFIIPMHWSGNTTTNYNKMYPVSALTLSNADDRRELMSGTPLSYVYAQSYIPLYAVYDFENKEYAYVFDNRYVEVENDGVVNLNLFELKVMNENGEVSDEEQEDITNNRQRRAITNVNTKQFNKRHFNIEVE